MNENIPKILVGVTVVGLMSGALMLGDITKEEIVNEVYFYQAPWEWFCEREDFCYWQAPNGSSLGAIDLRSTPQMSQIGGTPQGVGIFTYSKPQVIENSVYLGTDKELVASYVWDKLTIQADPTGISAPKPLQGRLGKNIELYIAGELVKSEPFNDAHRQRTIDVFKADYEQNVKEYPKETIEKWVGATMTEVYGEMSDEKALEIVPTKYHNQGKLWRKPETTIGDTFTDTNGTDLASHTATGANGGFSWTEVTVAGNMEVQSNHIQPNNSSSNEDRDYRAESDLSTDDMYAKATIGTTATSFDGAVDVRFSSSARTHYQSEWGNTFFRISKFIAGSHTILQQNTSLSHSAGDVMEVRVNGSTIQAFRNGVQVGTDQTDTDITGHLRSGLNMWHGNGTWDDFEAGDLATAVNKKGKDIIWFE